MDKPNLKQVLWENIQMLMQRDFKGSNKGRVAERGGFAPANMTRVAKAETDVGIELIEKIAGVFDVEPWQLITPGLGAHLHILQGKTMVPVFDPKGISPIQPETRKPKPQRGGAGGDLHRDVKQKTDRRLPTTKRKEH